MQGKIGEIPVPRKPSIEGFGLEDLEPPKPDLSVELRRKAGRAATHPITRQQEEEPKPNKKIPAQVGGGV